MFRPLQGHNQAFLRNKSINAEYMLGFQLCLQLLKYIMSSGLVYKIKG